MIMHSALYIGQLRHSRSAPRAHAFSYRVCMQWLDLAELDRLFQRRWFWSTRRPTLAWLRRADYLGDPAVPLDQAVRDRVERETGMRPAGPIRMLTQLRFFGHCFNPVTFYYCYDGEDQRVTTIVAEITNTPWRERHAYVLHAAQRADAGANMQFCFGKRFHVSPFMPMDLEYDWRFSEPGERLAVHMVDLERGVPIFSATLQLQRRDMTSAALAGVLLRFPFATLRVLGAIYWQALRLWLKRVPLHTHPAKQAAGLRS
jgi:DUF1365 family protein